MSCARVNEQKKSKSKEKKKKKTRKRNYKQKVWISSWSVIYIYENPKKKR